MGTGIEWADEVWNPVVGCEPVSEGCANCYAVGWAARHAQNPKFSNLARSLYQLTVAKVDGGWRWTGLFGLFYERLEQPFRWSRPRRVFVGSMTDLFHPGIPFDYLDRIFQVMKRAHWHQYLLLTKRVEAMRDFIYAWLIQEGLERLPPQIAVMATVENQRRADERIPVLLEIPARWHGISVEPMLGAVDFTSIGSFGMGQCLECAGAGETAGHYSSSDGMGRCARCGGTGEEGNARLDWVICGGESGPLARPVSPDWVRSLRDQCLTADVSFFFKQWGKFIPSAGAVPARYFGAEVPEHLEKRFIDGHFWEQVPEFWTAREAAERE